jgi:hypothetical protein
MVIIKWAAVGVTLLMGLANFGQVTQDVNVGWKIVGLVLALAALAAVVGVVVRASWGTAAVIAIGAVNVVAAIIGAFADVEGWPIGLVLSALGAVLGAVYASTGRQVVAA